VISRERRLRWESIAHLVVARMMLKLVPFRWLTPLLELSPRGPELDGVARRQARDDVRRAVHCAAERVPGTFCFPKAIAAQAMLRRRGVTTTLYWGAATIPGQGLAGHVWVQDGEVGVQGRRPPGRYKPLANYSGDTGSRRVP
jgi:hypothetical protein